MGEDDTSDIKDERPARPVVPAATPEVVLTEDAESPLLTDEKASAAVDDIVAHEGDEVLEAEDNDRAARDPLPVAKHGFWCGVGAVFRIWLGTSAGRWITFVLLVAALGVVGATPSYRYFALNTAGVQAGASVTVVDELTELPLKNVDVGIAGQHRQTDAAGRAVFTKLKLGPTHMNISQPGFSTVDHPLVLGWGSNPLGSFPLQAVGARYGIVVQDWLTGKPLAGVQATSGDAAALSDRNGNIELALENAGEAAAPVTLAKDGYRMVQVTLKSTKEAAAAAMVPAQKAVFVDKSSGRYDLYQSDIDGANKEMVLPGSGQENGNIAVVESPDQTHAAIVSTRSGRADADGFLLSTLTLVDLSQKTATTLAEAGQIQLIDWAGTRLVFERISSDPSTPPNNIVTVVSYDYAANSRVQLAAAPKLTGVQSAQGIIFYAIPAASTTGAPKPGLYRVNIDGGSRQIVFDQPLINLVRGDFNTLALQTADGWTAYTIPAGGAVSKMNPPADLSNRLYADNADHSKSLWARPGALLSYDTATTKDTVIQTQDGLTYPVQWLDNAILYRVVTDDETADYVVSSAGGPPHKLADVAPGAGFISGQ